MPFYTKNYGLYAIQNGQVFQSSQDRDRILVTDQLMAFISDLSGDGIVSGFQISDTSSSLEKKITVSKGLSIINRFGSFSYADVQVQVPYAENYIYLKRRQGVIGGKSGRSNISNVLFNDSFPTYQVVNVSFSRVGPYSLTVNWPSASDLDIDYYQIQRSVNNFVWQTIGVSDSNSFFDEYVSQNTLYYYRVTAVDYNGTAGPHSPVSSVSTPQDMSVPQQVSGLVVVGQNASIAVSWKIVNSENVSGYSVQYYQVDDLGVQTSSSLFINTSSNSVVINGLLNSTRYSVGVSSVSINGVNSSRVSFSVQTVSSISSSSVSYLSSSSYISNQIQTNCYPSGCVSSVVQSPRISISWSSSGSSSYLVKYGVAGSSVLTSYSVLTGTSSVISNLNSKQQYVVYVYGVDSSGNIGNGFVKIIQSASFVGDPYGLSSSYDSSGNFNFYWSAADGQVNYYSVSSYFTDQNNNVTNIDVDKNVGLQLSYSIGRNALRYDGVYTFSVKSVGFYSNAGNVKTLSVSNQLNLTLPVNPQVPGLSNIYSNDGYVSISWNALPQDKYISKYKIWRVGYHNRYKASSYQVIATVNSDQQAYDDYYVSNGNGYVYFVTSVDVLGNQSQNPSTGFISWPSMSSYPHENPTFTAPSGLSTSIQGRDVQLSWDLSYDQFQFYQIFRSSDMISFQSIASVTKNQVSYTDKNVLKKNGKYYYFIRKVRNDTSVYVSDSYIVDANYMLISTVSDSSSGLSIVDNKKVLNANNLELSKYVQLMIKNHSHTNSSIDRRIDLSSSVQSFNPVQLSDVKFQFNQYVSGADFYVVKINGTVSSIQYTVQINGDGCVVVFSSSVSALYSSGYTVSLLCVNLQQTDGILSKSRLKTFFANNVQAGQISPSMIPRSSKNHDGRIRQKLVPVSYLTTKTGPFSFEISMNGVSVRSGLNISSMSVYDIQQDHLGNLILGTSIGFVYNDGSNKLSYATNQPVLKILKVQTGSYVYGQIFYASTVSSVYFSRDGKNWISAYGLDHVSMVKDMCIDYSGNLYISTDLGVFYYNYINSFGSFKFIKTSEVFAGDSDCYGIHYNSQMSRVYVSTQSGVFYLQNIGEGWVRDLSNIDRNAIYQIVIDGDYVFGIKNKHIVRASISDGIFHQISNKVIGGRKISVKDGRLLITSNDGFLINASQYDIYSDYYIFFEKVQCGVVNNTNIDPLGLKVSNGSIYFGSDFFVCRTSDFQQFSYILYSSSVSSPSFFINNQRVSTGVFYGKGGIFIDNPSVRNVSVATRYDIMVPQNGGWISNNYNPSISVYRNNESIGQFSQAFNYDSFRLYSFPSFTQENSNSTYAKAYKANYSSQLSNSYAVSVVGQSSLLRAGQTVQQFIGQMMYWFDKANSQLLGTVNYYQYVSDNSSLVNYISGKNIVSSVVAPISENGIRYAGYLSPYVLSQTSPLSISIQATYGVVYSTSVSTVFYKYDNMSIDILKSTFANTGSNTHRQIQDAMSMAYSGLSLSMQKNQQSNQISQGLALKSSVKYGQLFSNIQYRSSGLSSVGTDAIDELNSTVGYSIRSEFERKTNFCSFPYCAYFDRQNENILIGGDQGLFLINTSTLKVSFDNRFSGKKIRSIKSFNNNIYVLTKNDLYFSKDGMLSWKAVPSGLSGGQFTNFHINGSDILIFSQNGTYYKKQYDMDFVFSKSPVNVFNLTFPVAFSDSSLYLAGSVPNSFTLKQQFTSFTVNDIAEYKNSHLVASNTGLLTDNGTVFSGTVSFSTVNVTGNPTSSQSVRANCIYINGSDIYVGSANGSYWQNINGTWTNHSAHGISSVYKILVANGNVWTFGNGVFNISSQDFARPISG